MEQQEQNITLTKRYQDAINVNEVPKTVVNDTEENVALTRKKKER